MPDSAGYADVNGLRTYYEMSGEGPPLLMLHGGTCSIETMEISFFSSSFLVIAPEQMGHGRTVDAPDREFHYHDMAEDTVELLRRLEIDNVFVFGFSDGGILGLDMAIHHPDVVSGLAISGANFRVDGLREQALHWMLTTEPDDWVQELRECYGRLSPDGPRHWPVVLQRLKSMWPVEPDYTSDQLSSIRARTLVIAGDQDIVTPEHSVALFNAIPDAQLCVLPGTGHGAMPHETIRTFLTDSTLRADEQGATAT